MKKLLTVLFFISYYLSYGQVGGAGVCHVAANPNTISDLNSQDARSECLVSIDTTNGTVYVYNATLTSGSRWVNLATDTDTRLNNIRVQNDSLKFDIINVSNSSVIGFLGIPISSLNIIKQLTAGTGITITDTLGNYTITNSLPDQVVTITGAGINNVSGTYPNFTITGTEVDGSVTNEGSLTVTAGTGTTSVINSNTSGSTPVTVAVSTGLSIAEAGNTITLTNSAPDQTVTISGTGITVGGAYPSFTLTAADQSATNEIQTIDTFAIVGNELRLSLTQDNQPFKSVTLPATDLTFTGTTAPFTLNSSTGTDVTINSGVGIEITRSSNELTIKYREVSARNHADAATLGVSVGDYFYTAINNTMGMPPGVKIRRAY